MHFLALSLFSIIGATAGGRSSYSTTEDESKHCVASDGRCCETKCPYGWLGYDGKCYQFYQNARTWTEAKHDCLMNYGSHLVEVNAEDESNWLKMQMSTSRISCPHPDALRFTNNGVEKCFWTSSSTNDDITAGNSFCTSTGGHLADIPDKATFDFIVTTYPSLVQSGLWIAVRYDDTLTDYVDSQGDVQTFREWDNREPDAGAEKCVFFFNGKWHDAVCSRTEFSSLCEYSYQEQPYWIGASDSHLENDWRWVWNAKPLLYTEYSGSAPDGGTAENCLAYNLDYKWSDFPCSHEKWYICELDADCHRLR